MPKRHINKSIQKMEDQFFNDLMEKFGALIGGDSLRKVLGYKTQQAFRQANSRNLLPIQVFVLQNRRGKFAYAKDIAIWLARVKTENVENHRIQKGDEQ